jgi:hypothetical protein
VAKSLLQEDKWLEYFASIRTVCPWSYPAYAAGEILIVQGVPKDSTLAPYRARVYLLPDWSPRRIKKLAGKLDNTDLQHEWLWSHPRYGGYSAPVGCVIQQDRQELAKIRQRLKEQHAST